MKLYEAFNKVRKKVFVIGNFYKIARDGKYHSYAYKLVDKKHSDFMFEVYDSQGISPIHRFGTEHHTSIKFVPLEMNMKS